MELSQIKKTPIIHSIDQIYKYNSLLLQPLKKTQKIFQNQNQSSIIDIKKLINLKSNKSRNDSTPCLDYPLTLTHLITVKKDNKFRIPLFSKNNSNDNKKSTNRLIPKIKINNLKKSISCVLNVNSSHAKLNKNDINNIRIYNNNISIDNSYNTSNVIINKNLIYTFEKKRKNKINYDFSFLFKNNNNTNETGLNGSNFVNFSTSMINNEQIVPHIIPFTSNISFGNNNNSLGKLQLSRNGNQLFEQMTSSFISNDKSNSNKINNRIIAKNNNSRSLVDGGSYYKNKNSKSNKIVYNNKQKFLEFVKNTAMNDNINKNRVKEKYDKIILKKIFPNKKIIKNKVTFPNIDKKYKNEKKISSKKNIERNKVNKNIRNKNNKINKTLQKTYNNNKFDNRIELKLSDSKLPQNQHQKKNVYKFSSIICMNKKSLISKNKDFLFELITDLISNDDIPTRINTNIFKQKSNLLYIQNEKNQRKINNYKKINCLKLYNFSFEKDIIKYHIELYKKFYRNYNSFNRLFTNSITYLENKNRIGSIQHMIKYILEYKINPITFIGMCFLRQSTKERNELCEKKTNLLDFNLCKKKIFNNLLNYIYVQNYLINSQLFSFNKNINNEPDYSKDLIEENKIMLARSFKRLSSHKKENYKKLFDFYIKYKENDKEDEIKNLSPLQTNRDIFLLQQKSIFE